MGYKWKDLLGDKRDPGSSSSQMKRVPCPCSIFFLHQNELSSSFESPLAGTPAYIVLFTAITNFMKVRNGGIHSKNKDSYTSFSVSRCYQWILYRETDIKNSFLKY